MPAKLVPDSDLGAGIQERTAQAWGEGSWIPGLALLARNDAVPPLRINMTDHSWTTTQVLTGKKQVGDEMASSLRLSSAQRRALRHDPAHRHCERSDAISACRNLWGKSLEALLCSSFPGLAIRLTFQQRPRGIKLLSFLRPGRVVSRGMMDHPPTSVSSTRAFHQRYTSCCPVAQYCFSFRTPIPFVPEVFRVGDVEPGARSLWLALEEASVRPSATVHGC